jgi:beta-N-acetylhexosaminidase
VIPSLPGVVAVVLTVGITVSPTGGPTYDGRDPQQWGDRRLAAQLVFSCVDLGDLDEARRHAELGVGGIALLGSEPPSRLRHRLHRVSDAARTPVLPFLASDEEGGTVQRLREAIYPLPSARRMGSWRPERLRREAQAYAERMRRLGVRMDLAPVADLAVPGSYIDSLGRAFDSDPDRVTRRVRAWRLGMQDAGVVSVLKHWPGHGSATNSHTGPARVPPLDTLERRDLIPFSAELAAGAEVVMVGHLLSKGLTRQGIPTSLSPRALRYLRTSAGPDTVIVTDSLTMAAASRSLGISPSRAAVRALRAGADWAMTCDAPPRRAVAAVRRAIEDGRLPRGAAVASARRILELKARWRLAPSSVD